MKCSVLLCVSSNEASAYDVRFVHDVTVSMLVYPNNLNYLHNNRGYFRFILGKNGITPMALCGYTQLCP